MSRMCVSSKSALFAALAFSVRLDTGPSNFLPSRPVTHVTFEHGGHDVDSRRLSARVTYDDEADQNPMRSIGDEGLEAACV